MVKKVDEILLLKDCLPLGRKGGVISVARGYFANFLEPKGFAVHMNPCVEALRKKLAKEREEAMLALREDALAIIERLEGKVFDIPTKVNHLNHLFGSVTSFDLQKVLLANEIELDKSQILLKKPIRSLGEYTILLDVHGLEGAMKVNVKPEDDASEMAITE